MFNSPARLVACSLLVIASGGLRAQNDNSASWFQRIVFFPPPPPIYGAAIPDEPALAPRLFGGRRMNVPDGLAAFVSDSFYPALSTRLYVPELNSQLETRLQQYRERRQLQIDALLNEFVALDDATPQAREKQLRALSATQTPQLVALESAAEQLRRDLISGRLFNNVDWNAGRRWRLGAIKSSSGWVAAEAEFQVVRAAAFYQDGVVAEQRGLLRELAIELEAVSRKARGLPSVRAESDAMFFSPETARFRLPPGASPLVREKLAAYNGQKAALKQELRAAVNEADTLPVAKRTQYFEELADRQWPELKSLEERADEIRVLLNSRMEISPPPAPPWLPPGLMADISSYNEDRDTYFAELKRHTASAVARLPKPDPYSSVDERQQHQHDYAAHSAAAAKEATLEFQREHRGRYEALVQRFKMIRDALTVVAAKQKDRETGRALDADTLLRQHGASMREFDAFGLESVLYRHYRIAMLQPGLSAEQRRLLFGYAMVGLAQPLPGGELVPAKSATRPYPSW